MISKQELLTRIELLQDQVKVLQNAGQPTLSVQVFDEDGERVMEPSFNHDVLGGGIYVSRGAYKYKKLSFQEVCHAIQEMCGIEITYQEIKGSEGVVIYERDDD